jgi:hypothetical protein
MADNQGYINFGMCLAHNILVLNANFMRSVLKSYKVIISSLVLIACFGVSSVPIFAETVADQKNTTKYEIFEMEEDFMENFKDLGDCVNVKIKIYSIDNRLVRCGSEKSDMIMDLLQEADFLADVGGTEIYRLNK